MRSDMSIYLALESRSEGSPHGGLRRCRAVDDIGF